MSLLPPPTKVRPPMSQKSEIKVYLPLHLIGELESLKRNGNRSHFIEKAIREKLKNVQGAYMDDYQTKVLLAHMRDRFNPEDLKHQLLQIILDEVNV